MEVVYHRLFQRDINTAVRYYDGEGGEQLGDRFFTEVETTVQRVLTNTKGFHFAAEGIRRAALKKFPYHVLYEENERKLKFLVLRHDRRHPSYGMSRR